MTPKQVKAIRKRLGLTRAAAARTLGVSWVTVYRWEEGLHPIQGPAAAMLTMMDSQKKGLDTQASTA